MVLNRELKAIYAVAFSAFYECAHILYMCTYIFGGHVYIYYI